MSVNTSTPSTPIKTNNNESFFVSEDNCFCSETYRPAFWETTVILEISVWCLIACTNTLSYKSPVLIMVICHTTLLSSLNYTYAVTKKPQTDIKPGIWPYFKNIPSFSKWRIASHNKTECYFTFIL